MQILLFDTPARTKLFPLTQTRAVAALRFGIFTIKERWEKLTGLKAFVLTTPLLQKIYQPIENGEYILIDASILTTKILIEQILQLKPGEGLFDAVGVVAVKLFLKQPLNFDSDLFSLVERKVEVEVQRLEYPHQIAQLNSRFIHEDFELACQGKLSSNNYDTVQLINSSKIFIDENANLSFSILNATDGPIYIGNNATVMEGSLIRGPFVLGEGATLKMGSKIYGATTIGPYCVAGGEIKNSILSGYSNKAHDGYLGDSVIGEWCNLGAGTSNSNIKNTAGTVNVWNYFTNNYINAGTKAGIVMGDYSRTAINTSMNTGSMVGVCCNVFGEGLTPKLLPDFSWGNDESCRYEIEKAISDISNWKALKNKTTSTDEENILRNIFDISNT